MTPDLIDPKLSLPADLPAEDDSENDDVVTDVTGPHVKKGPELATKGIIPTALLERYEFYSYRHAAEILHMAFSTEFAELLDMLDKFSFTVADIQKSGGSESEIPKKVSALLRSKNWVEMRVQGDLTVRLMTKTQAKRHARGLADQGETHVVKNYVDGHLIDYVKGRVAFDLEWNSKDQTFDRDLFAMASFSATNSISAGVLLTRSAELDRTFPMLGNADNGKPVSKKFGASTTWMGKLLYRLETGRNGSCPVLAIGIKPGCISDLTAYLSANPYTPPTPKPATAARTARPKKTKVDKAPVAAAAPASRATPTPAGDIQVAAPSPTLGEDSQLE